MVSSSTARSAFAFTCRGIPQAVVGFGRVEGDEPHAKASSAAAGVGKREPLPGGDRRARRAGDAVLGHARVHGHRAAGDARRLVRAVSTTEAAAQRERGDETGEGGELWCT